jgi:hypothetical protein
MAAFASAQSLYTLDGRRGIATGTDPRTLAGDTPVVVDPGRRTILCTLTFAGAGPDSKSVSHKVFTNTPGDPVTFNRSISATASGPNLVHSNAVSYRVTCT